MRASLFSILRERNFPRAVGGSKKRELCLQFMNKSAQKGGPPPPHAPLHTHPHTSIHARTPNPHTQPPAAAHTHIRPHTAAGWRPASLPGRRPAAWRPASLGAEANSKRGTGSGDAPRPVQPGWKCKNRFRRCVETANGMRRTPKSVFGHTDLNVVMSHGS